MKILFWDTETTGLFDYKKQLDDPSQPRIIQICGLLVEDGDILESYNEFIKPDGWTVPEDATEVNGITTAMCEDEGIPIVEAIAGMEALAMKAALAVAHNISFDMAMYNRETVPLGMTRTHLRDLPRFCTMKRPSRFKGKGYPNGLGKLYLHLFGESHDGSHSAFGDALATMRCYYALIQGLPIQENPLRWEDDDPADANLVDASGLKPLLF